jgi:hypothetical protein
VSLKLRGNAWYLKKTVKVNGVSKVREFPLRIYGGEAARKKAETAATKLEKQINEANAAAAVWKRSVSRNVPRKTLLDVQRFTV